MKKSILALAIVIAAQSAFAQGTLTFQTSLDGARAVPPNASGWTAQGMFTLNPSGLFSGNVGVTNFHIVNSVALFHATSSTEMGSRLFDFTPGLIEMPDPVSGHPRGQLYHISRSLTTSELRDLQSGLWWVSVLTPEFPSGEIRGQITTIPEPATYALAALGTAALWLVGRHRKEP